MFTKLFSGIVGGVAILSIGVGAAFLSSADPAAAQGRTKVELCHYQPDNGTWKKIKVGEKAATAHLQNHDDALPATISAITDTPLDSECDPLPLLESCGNCLIGHGGLGCDNAACEAAVCTIDPFCCDTAWDGICAAEAVTECVDAAICSVPD